MTNCPNCGAIISGPKCEYCGTRFSSYTDARKLEEENECIAKCVQLKNLYYEALKSMRMYG